MAKAEWRAWLAEGRDFGQLVSVAGDWPVVVPVHFLLDDDSVLVHLARGNPIWPSIESSGRALLCVVDDDAYIPSHWRGNGVPTSYYSALQLRCAARVVDDPSEKAALLTSQLRHFQPEGQYDEPSPSGSHAALLNGIRGLRLTVLSAHATFKFDDHKPVAERVAVAARLERRGRRNDACVAELVRRPAAPDLGAPERT